LVKRVVRMDAVDYSVPLNERPTRSVTGAETTPAAAALREYWVQLVRQWLFLRTGAASSAYGARPIPDFDGGRDSRGTRRSAVWQRLIDKCAAAAVAPEDFLEDCLLVWTGSTPPPAALVMSNDVFQTYLKKSESIYRDEQARVAAYNRQCIRLYRQYAKPGTVDYSDETAMEQLDREILANEWSGIPAIYRYCMAARLQRPWQRLLRRCALRQYLARRGFWNRVLGDLLPPDVAGRTWSELAEELRGEA